MRKLTASFVALAAAALTFSAAPRSRHASVHPPKLAVLLMVDQMRADYIERFQADWTGGLKRLTTEGAWFRRAAYPYLTTVTCAGHATVSSGAFPHTTGVIQNAWWDRQRRENMSCTDDPSQHDIAYGGSTKDKDSAWRLMVPSFADEMRAAHGAHVVTLSLKDRSAIMLAGHGGDAVTWLKNSLDGWETSTAFAASPVAAVQAFVEANPIDADFGETWTRSLPESHYEGPDEGEGEAPPKGWTRTFPHALTGGGKPDAEFHNQWERSPFADAYLGRFAAALVEAMQLGRHDGTDVLAVSFSSPDLVGHAFGPRSQEIQDMYAHLDKTIGTLLDRLDALVGRDEYVVALTADHGVTPLPEQLKKAGRDGGRLDRVALTENVNHRAQAILGPGGYVDRIDDNDVYFVPGAYQKLRASPKAMKAVIAAFEQTAGVARAFPGEQVRAGLHSPDRLLRAAALSYFPGRSGDIIIALKPGWMFTTTGTTHGSANDEDQHVPILLMGRGVKPGQYLDPATPADVAPTLAVLCGIVMPKAEGRPLRVALTGDMPTVSSAAAP